MLRRENAHDIIVLMQRLAVVAPLDRVPPVRIRVAELSLHGECRGQVRVRVVAVHVWVVIFGRDVFFGFFGFGDGFAVGGGSAGCVCAVGEGDG